MKEGDIYDEYIKHEYGGSAPTSKINPKHYRSDKMQVIEVIEAFDLGFDLGNAVKYILRAGKKDDEQQDLKKALWYIMHFMGLNPHVNQTMAEDFLTNEKIHVIKKLIEALENHKYEAQTTIDEILSEAREKFSIH